MSADFYRELAQKADELLGDGEWHPYEKTMRALMRLVPPGPAQRRSERDRLASIKTRAGGQDVNQPRMRPRPAEEQIYSGQRAIVRDFLNNKLVFEADRPGTSHGGNHDRLLRMIGPHLQLRTGTLRDQRTRLEKEVRELRREINALRDEVNGRQKLAEDLRDALVRHGHAKDAAEIIEAYDDSGLMDAASSTRGKGKRARR